VLRKVEINKKYSKVKVGYILWCVVVTSLLGRGGVLMTCYVTILRCHTESFDGHCRGLLQGVIRVCGWGCGVRHTPSSPLSMGQINIKR